MDYGEPKKRLAWALAEVSELTGLSIGFLRNDVRAGRLRVRRFGRRLVVRDEDLQRYLEQGSLGNRHEAHSVEQPI